MARYLLVVEDAARPRPVGIKFERDTTPVVGRLQQLLRAAARLGFNVELRPDRSARQATLRPKQAGR
jgi:hypothetical protein